jgi:hypothetical protein
MIHDPDKYFLKVGLADLHLQHTDAGRAQRCHDRLEFIISGQRQAAVVTAALAQ